MSKPSLNVRDYNRFAWNRQVDNNNKFTIPVVLHKSSRPHGKENFQLLLTETKPVPQIGFLLFMGWTCLAWLVEVANRVRFLPRWEPMSLSLIIPRHNWSTTARWQLVKG